MQKVRALPTTLPLFFLNVEDAVNTKPKVNKQKKIVPVNGQRYRIEYNTPTGRIKTLTAKFQSKEKNAIFYDRWDVVGRVTYVQHSANVRIISKV